MKQGILELKAGLVKRLAHGDLAKAAKAVGVNRVVFYQWFYADTIWKSVDARNYNALKEVIETRENEFQAELAA